MRKNNNLEAFRKLSEEERVKIANKKLKDIEEPTFEKLGVELGFTNTTEFFSKYKINKSKELELKITNNGTNITDNLTNEDIKIIKEMISNYKLKKEIERVGEESNNIITRSIRVNKDIMTKFVNYCNISGIKQMQAINKALSDFINNNK